MIAERSWTLEFVPGYGFTVRGPALDGRETVDVVPAADALSDDDRKRLNEIAGELEHLPAEFRRHFDQDGRDARFLRMLAEGRSR